MEVEKYEDQNVLEYCYSENGKPLFKIKYDLNLDINSIFQPERLNPEAMNEVYSVYENCLSKTIPNEMKKIFCGCDSPNSGNK
jgi:hypothetical protein